VLSQIDFWGTLGGCGVILAEKGRHLLYIHLQGIAYSITNTARPGNLEMYHFAGGRGKDSIPGNRPPPR
jgi:hypothetical protein